MSPIEHIDEIIQDSFGLWITGLFSAIGGWNPALSFEQHKAAFFWLIEHLLRTGKIKFIAPGADCYVSPENPHPRFTIHDDEAQWNDSPEAIVAQLRAQWPQDARDEDDLDLIAYLYSMPGVIWVGDDGTLVAS
ncbi:hypothetical protein B0G76_8351 [Paraburkholderia sp. BL23I1N1]|uniref:hypothetical protein n=1 Tax=Paraburkholderia sp. BL23I1N1 TaxID=1938802 RepID=UPI000FF250DF|nr:hypothetical protein [Paraburkholderia sp. BL23I1N1]RKE24463.1 hypothetical protein B0G76_8351 [Paraburkholderia sp. BL23I1N1]